MENFAIPSTIVTDERPQITPKFFVAPCKEVGVRTVTTPEYHPQSDGHVKRFDVTMILRLRHYTVEYQNDCDRFVFPLTYAKNVQVHQTTDLPPFSRSITRLNPETTAITRPMPPDSARSTPPSPIDCTSSAGQPF